MEVAGRTNLLAERVAEEEELRIGMLQEFERRHQEEAVEEFGKPYWVRSALLS